MEDNRVKILYLVNSSEIGGAEKSLLLLIDNIDRTKFEISAVCLKGAGIFTKELEIRNIPVFILNIKKKPLSIFNVYIIIKRIKPDIIQSFLFVSNIIGRILGKLAGVKVIISSQRSVDKWRKWYHWKIDRLTSKFTTLIISNSFSGKRILVEKGKIKPEKIIVIPNGVKSDQKRNLYLKREMGFDVEETVIGTVGNLREVKDHKIFIKVASEISRKFQSIKFLIAGKGPLERELKKIAELSGLKKKIVFVGFIKEIEKVYSIIDIFVLTSFWEGCPLSILEAMSFGIPVVSFSVGDVPYIIQNGKDGFFVKDRDFIELIEKIKLLLKNETLRDKIGKNAKEKIKREFTVEKMVKRYTDIYLNLLKQHKTKGKINA